MKRKNVTLLMSIATIFMLSSFCACEMFNMSSTSSSVEQESSSSSSSSGSVTHTHDFATLKYDATKHWYECECGKKEGKIAHSGGMASCDEKATCSVCEQEYGEFLHRGGKASCDEKAICSLCGQEYGEFKHDFATLKYDAVNHWYECECGEKNGEAAHGTLNRTCNVCNLVVQGSKGFRYALNEDGQSYSVSAYTCMSSEVFIPHVYNNLFVTSIGEKAFFNCNNFFDDSETERIKFTSVVIPNSVTSIGSNAFLRCEDLTSVVIPNSVTSIGSNAFAGCTNLQYNEYDNGYYLGNEENPYLVLVKAKDTSISSCVIHDNTKIILSGAFQE